MANYQISATQIRENEVVLVKGELTFSRLAQLVEGEALARTDAQRVQNGMQPIGRPHTSVSLANAEVILKDAANPTIEEQFVTERRFTSKKHPEHGLCYSIDNKSTRLPVVAKLNEAGQAEQVQLAGELAAGVPVILVLRVYKPRNYANKGLSLDQVIIQDTEVKYYSGGAASDALAAAGITFATPIVPQQAAPVASADPAPVAGAVGQVSQDADAKTQAAQAAGAWPTAGAAPQADPFRGNAAPAAAPVASEDDDIEALQRKLAEAQARKQAADNSGSNSAFNPQPIEYNG